MEKMRGMVTPEVSELPTITDRLTFLYVESCFINRENSAITLQDKRGIAYLPVGQITVLLLGPGTNITHQAITLACDAGVTIIWVGEKGVRYYAHGRSLNTSSVLIEKQALLFTDKHSHLDVVRKMYAMRFPNDDVSNLSLQQLRGREGARIRKVYKQEAEKWKVEWNGRCYDPNDFDNGDLVNQALTAGHQCLYGLANAVIVAMGLSPALGFIHVGHEKSFVYDIADLYKAEITIPLAFELASLKPENISREMRKRTRDVMVKMHLLERMVNDIKTLLNPTEPDVEPLALWDYQSTVAYGKMHGDGE